MISPIDLRTPLLAECAKIRAKEVGCMISAGVDGISVAFACEELGKKVVAYSFRLDNRMPEDFRAGKARAKVFGWEFREILLPSDVENLKQDLVYLAELGCETQTDFECSWPFLYAIETIEERHIATGLGADMWFGLSRKDAVNWVRKGKFTELRDNAWKTRGRHQEIVTDTHAKANDRVIHRPYMSKAIYLAIREATWDQVNRPREKQPIVDAFAKKFHRITLRPHTNFNLGDSGFRAHFDQLLKTDLNSRGLLSVRGIYNDMVKRHGLEAEERRNGNPAGLDLRGQRRRKGV